MVNMTNKSRCQICGGLCDEEVLDGKNAPADLKASDGKVYCWTHTKFSKHADHPPYPAAENTKQEAIEDYQKWRREFKVAENLLA